MGRRASARAVSPSVAGGPRLERGHENLFEATLAALELLDGKTRGPRDEVAGEDYIAALLKDPRTSAAVLERGLRMLRPDHPALTLDRLRRFAMGSDEAVAIEAVRTLCQSPFPGRFAILSKLATDQNVATAASCRGDRGAGRRRERTSVQALWRWRLASNPSCGEKRSGFARNLRSRNRSTRALRAASRGDGASLELLASSIASRRLGRDGGRRRQASRCGP